ALPIFLPVTLLGPDIVVSSVYPSTAQMMRFTEAGGEPRERRSAAASACGTGGAPMPTEASGFAAQLLGGAPTPPRPGGGPDIGGRRNLMGGDVGQGLPCSQPDASQDWPRRGSGSVGRADLLPRASSQHVDQALLVVLISCRSQARSTSIRLCWSC